MSYRKLFEIPYKSRFRIRNIAWAQ